MFFSYQKNENWTNLCGTLSAARLKIPRKPWKKFQLFVCTWHLICTDEISGIYVRGCLEKTSKKLKNKLGLSCAKLMSSWGKFGWIKTWNFNWIIQIYEMSIEWNNWTSLNVSNILIVSQNSNLMGSNVQMT